MVKRGTERLRSQKVDPRVDNALAITTDGRKLALDARMLSAEAVPFGGSKMEAMLDRVMEQWWQTHDQRGTQMIFCDMGVNPTPWSYSVYEEIVAGLIARGMPRQEIAGEAGFDAKKSVVLDCWCVPVSPVLDRQHDQDGNRDERAKEARCPA